MIWIICGGGEATSEQLSIDYRTAFLMNPDKISVFYMYEITNVFAQYEFEQLFNENSSVLY